MENDCVTRESKQIESLTGSSSCIDLIFKNQPNFVIDSGVQPSLHPNCHLQIAFSKLSLKFEYPTLYERLLWDYKNPDSQSITKVIEMFN